MKDTMKQRDQCGHLLIHSTRILGQRKILVMKCSIFLVVNAMIGIHIVADGRESQLKDGFHENIIL